MKAAIATTLATLVCTAPTVSSAATKAHKIYNAYWAGALVNSTSVAGVKGDFVVPTIVNASYAQIAIGFDGFYCGNGFLAGVGWDQNGAGGSIEYYGYHQQDGYLTTPERYSSTDFSVKAGDPIEVDIVAINTTQVSLTMINGNSGSTIKQNYAVDSLCLNSVEWYIFNCQNYEPSCGAMGQFGTITISNAQYKLAGRSSYLPAQQSKASYVISPVKFFSHGQAYNQATAKFTSGGNIAITAHQAPT